MVIKLFLTTLLISALLVTPAFSAVELQEEGVKLGYVNRINIVGSTSTATKSGIIGTITIDLSGGILENLIPGIDYTYDIGEITTPLEWRHLYVDGVGYIDAFGQSAIPNVSNTYDLGSEVLQWQYLYVDTAAHIDAFAESILPYTDDLTIGSALAKWKDLYVRNAYIDNVVQSLLPNVATLDLGSDANEWRDLWIDGTAHIDTLDTSTITPADGSLTITGITTMANDLILNANLSIGAETTIAGNIRPSTANDLIYELGGESARYTRINTLEARFDPDTKIYFDGQFVRVVVNGIEYAFWGATTGREQVVLEAENIVLGGENVVF